MKVNCIATDTLALAVTPIGDRLYKVACDTKVSVQTDEGVFLFKFLRGFTTNFRSGGVAVDSFIDQIGDERKSLCYLVHDAIYTPCEALGGEHPLSRKKGDWFNVTDSGTLTYYANNDRSDIRTIQLYAGDDVYWTTNGTLSRKPSTAVQIFDMSVLSDWNDLTSSGLYQISVSGATRAPATGTFSCLVSNENGNIRQVAFNSTNIYYRGKASSGQAWTDWKNVDSVTHAANATTAANYITDQSTTVSIHSKFTSVDNQIYDISNYKKIRVVNNLPSSPDSDTIYFI